MELEFRAANQKDLVGLVSLLISDPLGRSREDSSTPLNTQYVSTFAAIDKDPNNEIIVVELRGQLVGMFQITFIPYLTHIGSWRCAVEGVRVHENFRGRGYGEKIFEYIIALAKEKGCKMIQLTSDKQRPDAIRFYKKLGFKASHEGFKLAL